MRRTSEHQVRLLANELTFVAPGALLEAMEGAAAAAVWEMSRFQFEEARDGGHA